MWPLCLCCCRTIGTELIFVWVDDLVSMPYVELDFFWSSTSIKKVRLSMLISRLQVKGSWNEKKNLNYMKSNGIWHESQVFDVEHNAKQCECLTRFMKRKHQRPTCSSAECLADSWRQYWWFQQYILHLTRHLVKKEHILRNRYPYPMKIHQDKGIKLAT